MLMTRAGLTFAAMRGSPTRPRLVLETSFRFFAAIEFDEEPIGFCQEIIISWGVVRRESHSVSEFRHKFGPIRFRQRFKFVKELLGVLRHGIRVPCCVLFVKLV